MAKTIATRLNSLLGGLLDGVGAARIETLEVLGDVQQVSDLLMSLEDVRHRRVVPLSAAFSDL